MAKPRLVDLKICFEPILQKIPVKIFFQRKENTFHTGNLNFQIDENFINTTIEFQIKNFPRNDNSQRIHIYFDINGKKQRLDQSIYYPDNLKSQIKENLDIINENGTLKINLSKEWFACNIFAGSCIYKDKSNFIHWVKDYKKINYDRSRDLDIKNYDIACVGASATWGADYNYYETWPYHLEKEMNMNCGNFGEHGIDHFTIAHNAIHFLKNYNTKFLILQFGPYDFLLPKRNKINDYYMHRIVVPGDNHIKNNEYNLQIERYREWCVKKYHLIKKIVSNKLISIKNFCDENKISLYVLYTDQKIIKYEALQEHFLPLYFSDFKKFNNTKYLKFALELKDILQREKK